MAAYLVDQVLEVTAALVDNIGEEVLEEAIWHSSMEHPDQQAENAEKPQEWTAVTVVTEQQDETEIKMFIW